MPELKRFPVFGESGRIGTLAAAARFLDSRSEKTVQLDDGGEISVPADSLTVLSDGSFYLRDAPSISQPIVNASAEDVPVIASDKPDINKADSNKPDIKMFREGYSIERVQVDRIVAVAPEQRQEGDTLILPVVEEVLVTEKRLMLREEIRITRRREQVDQIRTVDSSSQ